MLFLITGCSSGLGFSLAHAVLAAGHKVIASSRNPSKTPEAVAEVEKLGGYWITLDMNGSDVEDRIRDAMAKYGPIDVLINNAGYATGGVLEGYSVAIAHEQMETNFFGPIRTIKTVLPSMRERKSGIIVNISSAEFWEPHPVTTVYSASKFALEGLSEALSGELSAFNIRVLIAEPGGMRTNFVNPATMDHTSAPELHPAYKNTMADFVQQALLSSHGKQGTDPDKAAQAIVREVLSPRGEKPMLRMPLGKESFETMKGKLGKLQETMGFWEAVTRDVDHVDG